MVEVRLINDNEIEEAKAIMSSSFPKAYHSIFYLYPESTLIASENGVVLGGVNLDIFDACVKVGYIGWLYVSDRARGIGIGKKLIDEAIVFLEDSAKVDEILLCIEGDNPSSFKQVSSRDGFEIMSLQKEICTFKWNIFKVYSHASRFFDMGYFLWHKNTKDNNAEKSLEMSYKKQIASFLCTIVFNTALYLLMALKFKTIGVFSFLVPSIVLIARTTIEAVVIKAFKEKPIFLAWDSSWLSSLISIIMPFYFPSPGGIYIRGDEWSIKEKSKTLALSAISTVIVEALLLLLFRKRVEYILFALPLFLLDTVFPFYPFCGFLSSRIKRYTGKYYSVFIIFAITISLFLMLF